MGLYTFKHRMVGHRAGGKLVPENTLAGFRMARELGYKAVEFDAMLTQDGIPVINHDPTFGRTIQKAGELGHTDLVDFLRFDAGSWHSDEYAFEPPITLETAVRFCERFGIWMNIEIKPFPGLEAQTGEVVARTIQAWGIDPTHVLFSSFKRDALLAQQRVAPEYARGFLVDDIPDDLYAFARQVEAVAIHVNHKKIDRAFVEATRHEGFAVFAYTVNDFDKAIQLYQWGVSSMCTDQLRVMQSFATEELKG